MASYLRKVICAGFLVPGRIPVLGRPFLELARACAGSYKDRRFLGGLLPWPWISPRAEYSFRGEVRFGCDVFVDDHCVVYSSDADCRLIMGDRVSVYRGTVLHLGAGGSLEIGDDTHLQNDCQITALGSVRIGSNVQLAPRCALYPYDHSFDDLAVLIKDQPLRRRGGIVIEDDAWLGVGVIVLDGVTIGRGAVVGAGAVVTKSIPEQAVAAGVPAVVIGHRSEARAPAGGP
ncbi:MAG: transferase [Deltaproteobacteria bacterium]|nr:transferase [Deltaproteobacteria bacterium]